MAHKRSDLALELAQLTKEELIERILARENKTEVHVKKRKERPMDFDAYEKQHVAMKVAYLGWDFHGFASQISFKPTSTPLDNYQISELPTVEEHLFKALMTAKLIENPTTANYSRCGRTDAGVSSTGQVIGVTIRSSRKKTDTMSKDLPVAVMLNSLLPPEIRILEVVPAPEQFTARFDCQYREYHYYFPRQALNIERMKEAAALLLGEHDFRNFCKRDPSKEVKNFVRVILESRIEPVSVGEVESPLDMFKFVIRGTAFLYHQVRCTMAVLFLVGQERETVDAVSYLLSNLDEEWRPTYQMASEIPLVLVECGFEKVKFSSAEKVPDLFCNDGALIRNQRHLFGIWKNKMAQALTVQWLLKPEMVENDLHTKVQTILRK